MTRTKNKPIHFRPETVTAFQKKMLDFYKKHGRKLPFRQTDDPYRITVSEIMLQQTQVERVVPMYEAWIERWPDWRSLAKATRRELLSMWSGLGYNRRAIYLGEMAREIAEKYDGVLPTDPDELLKLPGIGPYTSRAVLIFAFNKPLITIDTNIRRVLIHELRLPSDISANELELVAVQVLPKRRSRIWHYALMDYSRLALPRRIVRIPPLSRQSKFEGSLRQIRGEIVRRLTSRHSVRLSTIAKAMDRSLEDVLLATRALEKEGLVIVTKNTVKLK
jgi:A/G-specific adenine glycosylase